jgi:hypothetical protein
MPRLLTVIDGVTTLINIPRVFTELLTAGTNTISNLTFTPDFNYNVQLFLNGKCETVVGNSFSVSGKVITWIAANAGYNIDSTFEVVARYTTNE